MRKAKSTATAPEPLTFLDPSLLSDMYGMGIIGTCMEPHFPDGCSVKVSKPEPYGHGDVVVVWLRPEIIKPGGVPALIKRIGMMPPPWVTTFPYKDNPESDVLALVILAQEDQPGKLLRVRCSDVIAIHKVLGIFKAGGEP